MTSFVTQHMEKRGVVDACCEASCNLSTLVSYCP